MRSFRSIMLFFFCLMPLIVFANPAGDLANIFKDINTIKGQFKQMVYDGDKQVLGTSTGNFVIKRPNQFRWNAISPLQQLTIADGKQIWLYQPDLQQVTVAAMSKRMGQTPLAILSGSISALTNNYTITRTKEGVFVLVSKQSSDIFHKIELSLTDDHLNKMILYDTLGQQTVIQFSDIKYNDDVNNNTFRFKVPKGVDVIKGSS